MIWADRIGVAISAIIVLACALLYAGGLVTRPTIPLPARTVTAEELKKNPLADLQAAYDAEGTWTTRTEPGNIADAAAYAVRAILWIALPAWLILRILDFAFGGPARRRARING